jgi:amino acid adenylation domain-containing protein
MTESPTPAVERSQKRIKELSPQRRAVLEKLVREQTGVRERPSTIARRVRGGPAPLSYAQERLWVLDQLMPGNTLYNVSSLHRIPEPVDKPVLERSLNEVVRRHECLRTTFRTINGEPFQVVAPALSLPLRLVDLAPLDAPQRETEAIRLATEESQRPFDLARGPLLRATLFHLERASYLFCLTMHHIISDGWSMGIFWKELATIWDALADGRPSPLPELPIQYADFAVWQRGWLRGDNLEKQLAYWKNQLANVNVLQLPTDHPRPAVQSGQGGACSLRMPQPLAAAIRSLCQQEGVTLFMTLLAAFQTLLSRYADQDDVAVGTFIANRNHVEIEGLIGFFVNTLVLRADFSGNPSFRTVLRQVRATTLDAYAHEDLPFGRLVQELQPERDLSRNPLFQVAFQLSNDPAAGEADSDSSHPLPEATRQTALFDLTLSVWESADSLAGEIEYSSDLFEVETIKRMATHYQTLLEGIVAYPDRRVRDLPLMSGAERQHFAAWNRTTTEYPRAATIVSLFEAQVARNPDAIALRCEGKELSYQELNQRANQLGRYLRRLGVRPEMRVGICVERSTEMVVGLLAILKAGGAFVPLDPAYPTARLAYMAEDAGLKVLVSQRRLSGRLPQSGARILFLDDARTATGEIEDNLDTTVTPDNLAYVIYTSGSTGKPKGVLALHRSAVNRFAWMWEAYPFEPREVCCARTSLSFVDSVWEIFGPLLAGIPTVIIPEEKLKDVPQLVATLADCRVTRLVLVPSLLAAMLDSLDDLGARLRALKYWVASGEALSADLARRFRRSVPQGVLINLYGSSEVAGDSTCFDTSRAAWSDNVPIGRPIGNVTTYIVDRHLQPVPLGVPGELLVGGDGLARGYHNLPGLTAERFIPDPFGGQPAARLYRTGDRARYLTDGNIEFLGRSDRQVKIRGFRLEPAEVEAVLAQDPRVQQAVVVAHGENEAERHLVAYIVRNPAANGSAGDGAESAWLTDQIRGWQEVWDETFRQDSPHQDPTFNTSGWTSSYTGAPIPAEEMRDWVEQSVSRVRMQSPSRVLDIGCGAGLLLFRLAPHCTHYCGTDVSLVALDYVERHRQKLGLHHVSLLRRAADDFSGFELASFDAVILNSVAQYFPHIHSLVSLLEGAIKVVSPGGFIFVGDVRSLPLLGAFHTSVELHRAAPSLPISKLQKRVREQMIEEEELVIDPAFFLALKEQLPQITHVEIAPKRGRHANELTRFRYDTMLEVAAAPPRAGAITWMDWQRDGMSVSALRTLLSDGALETLGLTGVPNARLAADVRAWELLIEPDGLETADDLRHARFDVQDRGVEPDELWAIEDEGSYLVHLNWPGTGPVGHFDAIFQRRDSTTSDGRGATQSLFSSPIDAGKPWTAYSNNPLHGRNVHSLVADLRRFVKDNLPEYMVPSAYVMLDAIPLTPNGKLDRSALLAFKELRSGTQETRLLPRTKTEQIVAGIWCQVLGVDNVATHDNFFDMGGHSLLATRVLSRVRDSLQIELPLRAVFDEPTIAGFAELIEQARQRGEVRSPTITRLSRAAHAVTLLPGGVLDPADLSRARRGLGRTPTSGKT